MNRCALFTDVSVNPQHRLGVGGYLLVPLAFLESDPQDIEQAEISARIRCRRFEGTSSTRLEVQTLLWALEDAREEITASAPGSLLVYSDSQCVTGLLGRRTDLVQNDYIAKRSGRPLAQALLYREFYAEHDRIGFRLIKVPGHVRADSHDTVQRIFSNVDRGVRKALTLWMESLSRIPDPNEHRL